MPRLIVVALMLLTAFAAENRVPSPSGKLFAHYTLCSEQNPCIPEVVITNPDNQESRRFQVRGTTNSCASILDVQWAGEKVIAAECNETPSTSYYSEVDLESGRVGQKYLGYGFVRAPDYSNVAHAGWIMHFAPPWVKSDYLMAGNTILYPLPPGIRPMEQKLLEMAPEVVKARGLVYADVHNFRSKFVWSPDSRRIGVVDCMVDYRLRDDSRAAFEEGGKEENLRCFAIAAGLDGKFIKTRIPPGSNQEFGLKWIDVRTLRVEHDTKSFDLLMPYERSKSSK